MIDIVIVNWNSGNQLRECLLSILDDAVECVKMVVVVDNGSVDNSIKLLGDIEFNGLFITILQNDSNLGFATACNQGAKLSTSDYVLFLNPDAKLTGASLNIPLKYMDNPNNSKVGICGVQLFNSIGELEKSCSYFPTLSRIFMQNTGLSRLKYFQSLGVRMLDWDHSSVRKVDQVIGAFFFVRSSLFNSLGGFDERFFVYYEEVDFSYRAVNYGYMTVYLSNVSAFHAGGGTSNQVKDMRLCYSIESRIKFALKHFNVFTTSLLISYSFSFELFARLLKAIIRQEYRSAISVMNAYRLIVLRSLRNIYIRY
jgi:GT2 family glycosyltransferase